MDQGEGTVCIVLGMGHIYRGRIGGRQAGRILWGGSRLTGGARQEFRDGGLERILWRATYSSGGLWGRLSEQKTIGRWFNENRVDIDGRD